MAEPRYPAGSVPGWDYDVETGSAKKAYIVQRDTPSDPLYFDIYPDEQSLGGGCHIGVTAIPGRATEIVRPTSRKAVEHRLSFICDELMQRAGPISFGARRAAEWFLRNLGPFGRDDTSNIFLLRALWFPEQVAVEAWSAKLQHLKPIEGSGAPRFHVVRFRGEIACKFYQEHKLNPAIFPARRGGKRKPIDIFSAKAWPITEAAVMRDPWVAAVGAVYGGVDALDRAASRAMNAPPPPFSDVSDLLGSNWSQAGEFYIGSGGGL